MHTSADRIRNVALVGHRGSGKTSLHEALLYTAGAVSRLGRVTEGTTVSDADADEKARQMSISAALTSFEWQERKVNLLDTPGEPSFVADALGALRLDFLQYQTIQHLLPQDALRGQFHFLILEPLADGVHLHVQLALQHQSVVDDRGNAIEQFAVHADVARLRKACRQQDQLRQ